MLVIDINAKVLLVSGHVGVLVTPEGRISRGSISWSATPVNIGYQFPYFIAVVSGSRLQQFDGCSGLMMSCIVQLPSHIEIHNAVNQALIQRMEWSQQTSLLSCSTLVLLASATGMIDLPISVLLPLPHRGEAHTHVRLLFLETSSLYECYRISI